MKELYSRIANSTPIDRTAAQVVQKGVHYDPTHEDVRWFSELPPCGNPPHGIPNYIGIKAGYLTVIGYSNREGAKWVCRCVCGRYEHRNAKSLKKNKHSEYGQSCTVCNNTQRVREGNKSSLLHKAAKNG